MASERIKWHPAFAAAIQLEFIDYKEELEFLTEYQLTDEPLRIDVLVIKKLKQIEITKNIGRIFRTYNIFEYKSPTDYISIDDYYKVKAYAYLYKALSDGTNNIDIKEMSITLTSNKYPRKLIEYLKDEQKVWIEKRENGIYYIKNTDIETQILVSKELDDNDTKYLKLLQMQNENKNLMNLWITEYINNIKNPLYAVIMNVLAEANPNEVLEVYKKMANVKLDKNNREFLMDMMKRLELDKKLKEEGIEEGIERGIEAGIERGKSEIIIKLLIKKFKKIPDDYINKIKKLSNDVLEVVATDIFDMEKVEELERYF